MSRIELPLLEQPAGLERQLGILLLNRGSEKISLPLGSVDINAKVVNQVAQVTITQVFRNDCTEHLEAVYVFPLAAGSAICSFIMKVGERVIKGIVQERAEARRQYQQALSDGKRAAMLEQERDDVFTIQVGNLAPGQEVTVEISYSERLPFYENGCNEIRLPLVVSPRYIPGTALDRDAVGDGTSHDTDCVPDASRITPPRLAQGVDPHTALKLRVDILPEDGAEICDMSCSQHATKTALSQGGLSVSLARADERLNRDFVLRWRSSSDNLRTSLLTYAAPDGETYGLLSIMPPKRNGFLGAARDIIFVLDRSGSMQGVKMTSAVRACSILLNTLGPQDRFAIAAFDNVVEWLPASNAEKFLYADAAGIESGEKYLRGITARGGTEMDLALKQSLAELSCRSSSKGRLASLVVLTDGEVGNESQILQRIQKEIGESRLFVVGIDTAVNSGLLKRLANLGGGTAAFVEPGIQLEEALASIGREIGAPLVTDIQVENLDLTVDRASLSPSRIPDIFAGRASVSFFKLSGQGKIKIKGRLANGKPFEEKVKAQAIDMPSIAQLWAKNHIVDLEDQFRISNNARSDLKREIIGLAITHSLLTKFTAFIVVDEAEIVNTTGDLRKVVQPVETPAGWEMEEGSAPSNAGISFCKQQPASAGWKMFDAAPAPQGFFQAPAPQSGQMPAKPAQSPPPPAGQPRARKEAQPEEKLLERRSKLRGILGGSAGAAGQDRKDESDSSSGFSSGSYGMSVRAQVLEVVVRQAIAGAPWRELCAGPMQVNNISPEEVETEIARRTALMPGIHQEKSKKDFAPQIKEEDIEALLKEFLELFLNSFEGLKRGQLPDKARLEEMRSKLLQALTHAKIGTEMPQTQKFIRSAALELIESLKEPNYSAGEILSFWQTKWNAFQEMGFEIEAVLEKKEAAFWTNSI